MIGLVGSDPAIDDLAAAATDIEVRHDSAAAVIEVEPEIIIAVGERAVIDLVTAGVETPMLPVAAGSGLGSVDPQDAVAAMDRLESGAFQRRNHPVLGVRLGEEHAGNAVFDVMLVTDEPARISEYSIAGDSQTERFRADGVVVSTPAGSHGYSNTAGGPILSTRTDAVSVVPIAAFTTRTDTWVFDPPIHLGIERDEGAISLLLDDREQCTVPNDRPITISVDDSFETVRFDG